MLTNQQCPKFNFLTSCGVDSLVQQPAHQRKFHRLRTANTKGHH